MESQRELPFESRSNIPLDPRTKIYLAHSYYLYDSR